LDIKCNFKTAEAKADTLLKKAKRSKDPSDWAEYRKARNKAVGLIKSVKRKYYVSKLENNQNNAKELWKTIKSISGMNKQPKRVSSLKAGEHLLEDNEQMASEFNSHFTSFYRGSTQIITSSNELRHF